MAHLTDAQIAALKQNYDPKIGPRTADEWMYCSTNSNNPLSNVAAINALLAHVLADSLNLQKSAVEQVTKLIEKTNDLKTDLEKYRPPSLTETGKLAGTLDEAKDIVRRLEEMEIDITAEDQKVIDDAFAQNKIPELKGKVWDKWSIALQGRSETLSAQSEQETLRLQTFTNRYTQANDQASTVMQKDLQSRGNINRNIGT